MTADILPEDRLLEGSLEGARLRLAGSGAWTAKNARLLEERIDALPDDYRAVFMLRAVEELSVEEAATALGIPEATVRTRHFRARALLRESLARDIDRSLEEVFAFAGERCDRIVAAVLARLQHP